MHRGVYVAMFGPTYETRAEYRMARRIGGDVAGMSTVPEVIAARHADMRVLGLSTITNVGSPDAPTGTTGHDVINAAQSASAKLTTIVRGVLDFPQVTEPRESAMNPVWIIAKKRDGEELTADEIGSFIGDYARGDIPDYQMSALAMAIYLRGMTAAETAALTDHMLDSGATVRRGPRTACRRSTSTPPAASATRSRCRSRRCSPAAACRCR